MPRLPDSLMKFLRLRLGLKPAIDYAESRSRLLGVRDLEIRTVFDVGANVGKMSRLYRRTFPAAKIYSIEPVPSLHQKLSNWASTQNGQVETMNVALGRAPGTATMYWNLSHSGGSTLVDPEVNQNSVRPNAGSATVSPIQVRVETLDLLAKRVQLRDEILVKIDVEGLDMEVIEGGMELLRRASAVIVEIGLPEAPTGRPSFGEFVKVLGELGYMYRGNLACAYVSGIARLADAVFIKQPALRRRAL